MKFISICLLVFLSSLTSYASDDCNSLLSNHLAASIQDLANLRYDLDSKIASGESNLVTHALQTSFDRKKLEILQYGIGSGLDETRLDSRLAAEIQKRQNAPEVGVDLGLAKAKQTQQIEAARIEFGQVGNMAKARNFHQSLLLDNGEVLIVGGQAPGGKNNFHNSVEIYNSETHQSREVGFLEMGRTNFSPLHVFGNKAMVSGGYYGGEMRSVEWIDLKTGAVSQAKFELDIRSNDKVYPVSENIVVIMGSSKTNFHAYDLTQEKSVGVLGMGLQYEHSSAVSLLPDQRLLISGGGDRSYSDLVQILDAKTMKATEIGKLKIARNSHAQTILPNNQVLITGGLARVLSLGEIERFDLNTNQSVVLGHMKEPRLGHSTMLLKNGKVLVYGGYKLVKTDFVSVTSLEMIDPQTGESEIIADAGKPISHLGAVMLPDGDVLLMEGLTKDVSSVIYQLKFGTQNESGATP